MNALIVQIGEDFYENLSVQLFECLLADLKAEKAIKRGSALNRQCSATERLKFQSCRNVELDSPSASVSSQKSMQSKGEPQVSRETKRRK